MSLSKAFWGARQSGKTTALHQWAWKKEGVIWFFRNRTQQRLFLLRNKNWNRNSTTLDLDAIRGCTYVVVDDADLINPYDLRDLVNWTLEVAIAFTPPMKSDKEDFQYKLLRHYANHENAVWMNTFLTAEELKRMQEQIPANLWRTQYEGQFIDDIPAP